MDSEEDLILANRIGSETAGAGGIDGRDDWCQHCGPCLEKKV